MPHHGTIHGVAIDREVEMPLHDRQLKGHAAIESRNELIEQRAIDSVELDLRRAMNALAGVLAKEQLRILVRGSGRGAAAAWRRCTRAARIASRCAAACGRLLRCRFRRGRFVCIRGGG